MPIEELFREIIERKKIQPKRIQADPEDKRLSVFFIDVDAINQTVTHLVKRELLEKGFIVNTVLAGNHEGVSVSVRPADSFNLVNSLLIKNANDYLKKFKEHPKYSGK